MCSFLCPLHWVNRSASAYWSRQTTDIPDTSEGTLAAGESWHHWNQPKKKTEIRNQNLDAVVLNFFFFSYIAGKGDMAANLTAEIVWWWQCCIRYIACYSPTLLALQKSLPGSFPSQPVRKSTSQFILQCVLSMSSLWDRFSAGWCIYISCLLDGRAGKMDLSDHCKECKKATWFSPERTGFPFCMAGCKRRRLLRTRKLCLLHKTSAEAAENFLLQSQLCVLTLIQCPLHPRVTAVACKRPWSFYQKCMWQITPKHTCIHLWPTKLEWADYAAVPV